METDYDENMKFYHYPHCPFCQRVRLLLKLLNFEYEDIVVSYADVKTPTDLIGSKMLPIVVFDDGAVMPESLDLMHQINQGKIPEGPLDFASSFVFQIPRYFDLILPWFVGNYQEFQDFPEGATYFQESKESRRGMSFGELKAEAVDIYEENAEAKLIELVRNLKGDFLEGDQITLADLVLAADLNGLRLVEGITLPIGLLEYMRRVEEACGDQLLER